MVFFPLSFKKCYRGAKLVGMSLIPLDVCESVLSPGLPTKKCNKLGPRLDKQLI